MRQIRPNIRRASTHSTRRALSLVELLVALVIALVFMGSVVTAFVQISRATDDAEAQIRAHTRARIAVDTIVRDLRKVRKDATLGTQYFQLTSNTLTYGDNVDNDDDGSTDEETLDGFDDDLSWNAADDDHHAVIGTTTEREAFVGVPDVGDFNVDEDVVFSNDMLSIRVPADPGMGSPAQIITYEIGNFDGMDHVLLREVVTNPGQLTEETTVAPLIFDVVSLDFLAWNPNDDVVSPTAAPHPYWQENWDAANYFFPAQRPIGAPFGVPPFVFPAAVRVQVTVSAERIPLEDIGGWPLGSRELLTESLATVVDLEVVIKDVRYELFVREM
ncbi:hypothetical protein KQI84_07870 [bacterium]|nr:hypothetical protein [bacterium]